MPDRPQPPSDKPPERIAAPPFAKLPPEARAARGVPVRIRGAHVDLTFEDIDNPYHSRAHRVDATNPRKIRAARNMNESPLVRLTAIGTLDEAQAKAGHHVRMLHEQAVGRACSPSLIRERVDGGQIGGGLTEQRASAAQQLARIADRVGPDAFRLLVMVCGEGRSLNEATRTLHRRKGTITAALKAALDLVAELKGLRRERR